MKTIKQRGQGGESFQNQNKMNEKRLLIFGLHFNSAKNVHI